MKRWVRFVGVVGVVMILMVTFTRLIGARSSFPPIVVTIPQGVSSQFYLLIGGDQALHIQDVMGKLTSVCPEDPMRVLMWDFMEVTYDAEWLELRRRRLKAMTTVLSADFSPDCKDIVFIGRHREDMTEVYSMNADGSNIRRWTSDRKPKNIVKYSPNGKWIGYTENSRDSSHVMTMEFETKRNQSISIDGAWYVDQLAWSPDGTMLAVTTDHYGQWKTIVLASDKLQIVQTLDCASDAAWSPDSQWIAFESGCKSPDAKGELTIVNIRTWKSVTLTQNNLVETDIQWVTNDRIIFLTYVMSGGFESQPYDWEIHEVRADGSGFTTMVLVEKSRYRYNSTVRDFFDNVIKLGKSLFKGPTPTSPLGGTTP